MLEDEDIPKTRWDLPHSLWMPAAELYGIQRFLAMVLGTVAKGVLGEAFRTSVKAIEARSTGGAAMPGDTVRAGS